MTRVISIQQSMLPDFRRPYPYAIVGEGDHSGYVLGQDFWKGEPYFLIGFQDRFDVRHIDLHMPEFLADPAKAVGKYAVFSDANTGGFYAEQVAISDVTVFDDPSAEAELALIPEAADEEPS